MNQAQGQDKQLLQGNLRRLLLWCSAYTEERKKCVRLQQPYIEEEDDIIEEYLFENNHYEGTKPTVQKF